MRMKPFNIRAPGRITWFEDSPDAPGEDCTCSVCGRAILYSVPLRIYSARVGREARFHDTCWNEVADLQLADPRGPDYRDGPDDGDGEL